MEKPKLKQIYPDFEKLKGVSPFWDSENENIIIQISDYEKINSLINDQSIDDKIDNICYILILLRKEKQDNDIRKSLKNNLQIRDNNRLEYSKFLKLQQSDKDICITNITLGIGKITGFSKQDNINTYSKIGNFKIQDAEIVNAVLQILNSKYKYKMSLQEDFKENLKQHRTINKPTSLYRQTAKSLKRYLATNTGLLENKQYAVIGMLFQLSGIETTLTENEYNLQKEYNPKLYKSFNQFVEKRIRNNYFK